MTPQEFVTKWAGTDRNESQSAQAHFLDVCKLVGVEMPGAGRTADGDIFTFEQATAKTQGSAGAADVFYEGHFAIEYKAPGKYRDLREAYNQLLGYREGLNNPPLLVVTDINNWEIHSNFPNSQKRVYPFTHAEIASNPAVMGWLRDMFHAPQRLHPRRNSEQVTREAAAAFQLIADNMRDWDAEPQRIAFFLTKLVFCLFAEDIGLLPGTSSESPQGIFSHIIEQSRRKPSVFQQYARKLFIAMNNGGEILMRDIPYFNGTLFDVVTVEDLSSEALDGLAQAAALDWSDIEPSIFGTLFERSLDPSKRSQLGAHYTSREDILLIVEPALMQPLRYHWETIQLQAQPIRERHDRAKTGRARANARKQLLDLRANMLERVRTITVLDPACGSGNFLYVALQLLMDMEKAVIDDKLWQGFQRATPEVHPRQMYGIELNPIAHALASIVVWIGYIQWRNNNGYARAFAEPILEKLQDNIVCKDAILPSNPPRSPHSNGGKVRTDELGQGRGGDSPANGAGWPVVDVIVGNPPFLGGQRMRGELGDEYYERLTRHYEGSVAGGADLVCYWYEVARRQIAAGGARRAGLLATNSIRGGSNREVLKRIKESGDIFMAWSDRRWILEGAAVRVSMVGFDAGMQSEKVLNGVAVEYINTDLTASVDIAHSVRLSENLRLSFQGPVKVGKFDIADDLARNMLAKSNPSRVENALVIKPYRNGSDLVKVLRNYWIIDFQDMDIEQAREFEAPFEYVERVIRPVRETNNSKKRRENWWKLGASGRDYREKSVGLSRQIFTPRVAKHRLFVWVGENVFPGDAVVAIARDDDYFFGVLHSKVHEVWSLRMGTSLEDRPRYTPTTTFETFPFPWPPGSEDESHPAHAAISAAAKQLHEERDAWLNPAPRDAGQLPPDASGGPRGVMKDRTLTNLYNALQVWRGESEIRVKPAAADFAPRLDELHRALDRAVCSAYGWERSALEDDEELLRRLLALNLARARTS
ncbi:MAG: class I SAM-dependent DNA methyltransferase [Chloroflexi bacterium]|nr:class I SAM-dependent DNA methyltransferase [Chloroflexota bacterium]